ncbi:UDP-N-acetylglucosamine 2-epimerase [Brevifollis gellanilyticus]|uniref:UDP-N-acetyl glucosamine 2-epimerase n=1 Tax=Brevifollis gellanilyticus TaxID=748831 RepID=A0A512M6Z2_9BACT|nr:UDP-N-acetylglucosamine 2-epimerase [Brevifollis gellanilyticus]GEP42497.1 UDP-N-acetyl glucosamine 2-epimerase [Brevifollis gellanilyticus]
MRSVGVVSVGRSDYSIYRPLLQRIAAHPDLELRLLVSGMHLEERYGSTVNLIEKDGFPVTARIPVLQKEDTAEAVAIAMGAGVSGFAQHFARQRPDLLVVLGDRFEMFAAALAAVPFNIPILHLHGGELTEGAMDDRFRHGLTKMSHLHGVATEVYRQRVIQLGEEPWRVECCGALSLDNMLSVPRLSRAEMETRFKLDLSTPPLLVTLHPTTSEYEQTAPQTDALMSALQTLGLPVIFTMPNADMAGSVIRERILAFCTTHPNARWVENFGPEGYFSILGEVSAMVGNSSSGLLEAPSYALPVVNIGNRQKGRLRAGNVIDVPQFEAADIVRAVKQALTPEFKARAAGFEHFFGDGHASERLLNLIVNTPLDERLLNKTFHDLPPS